MSALMRILLLASSVAVILAIVAADGRWTTALGREALTSSVVSGEKDSLKQEVQQNSAEVVVSTAEPPTPPSHSQTKEKEEPEKTDALEHTDGTTLAEKAPLEATTEDMFPMSFAAADRSLTEKVQPGGSSHSESSHSDSSNSDSHNSDSFNIDTTNAGLLLINEETPSGPSVESPTESAESQENVDPEVDSEEVFTSPGSLASLK